MNNEDCAQNTILIVDDNPTNLGVLFTLLGNSGFNVLVAEDGEDAIEQVKYALPDLILLDVIMPGIDGFEACRCLKNDESTKEIPVIFMTALSETVDKVRGLNLGAVDYITKPLKHEEVLARVQMHLRLRNLTKKLQKQNVQLEGEIQQRTKAEAALIKLTAELEKRVQERTVELTQANKRLQQEIKERSLAEEILQRSLWELKQTQAQLIQSEKMSALGQLVAGVAHEINNPVNFIYGNLSHVCESTSDLLHMINLYQQIYANPAPEIAEEAESVDLEFLIEDLPKMLSSMQVGAERIREIVLSLRRFSHQDGLEMKPTNIHEGIDTTLMILHHRLKFKPERPAIEVIKEYCPNLHPVECYGSELNQVFMNIFANAIDAIDEYNKDRTFEEIKANPNFILIRTEITNRGQVMIRIADNGLGMTPEVSQHIFDPFFTTKGPGNGTGIGLSISRQIIVEKHGGSLRCTSTPEKGTEFVIEIPIRHESQMALTG